MMALNGLRRLPKSAKTIQYHLQHIWTSEVFNMKSSKKKTLHFLVNLFIGSIWFANGFFCKILNLYPRHKEIISTILGEPHKEFFTYAIGSSELIMAIWVCSKYKPKVCALVQIVVILTMNIMENALVPELLLWGKWNLLWAILLSLLIYLHAFVYLKKPTGYLPTK